MRKTLKLVAVFMLAVVMSACGFHHAKQKMMNEGLGTLMKGKLDLSAQQVEQIDALTKGKMADLQRRSLALMSNMLDLDTTAADYTQQSQALAAEGAQMIEKDLIDFAETRAAVLAILNDEQKQKLKDMRAKMAERHAKRYGEVSTSP